MSEQIEVLRDVASRLDSAGVRYMVTGSMALNYYATPRMTRDIDIVVDLAPGDAARLVTLFGRDYYLDEGAAERAIVDRRMFNLIHLRYVVKVDFVVRKETEYRRLEFSRRRAVDVGGTQIPLASPEDLLLSKLAWARDSLSELQLGDARKLLAALPGLDREYLRHWAGALGVEALLKELLP